MVTKVGQTKDHDEVVRKRYFRRFISKFKKAKAGGDQYAEGLAISDLVVLQFNWALNEDTFKRWCREYGLDPALLEEM